MGGCSSAIPWLGYTWIGTTDTDFEGDPANARADAADVAYLMESAKPFLPDLDPGANRVQQRRRARAGDEGRDGIVGVAPARDQR